MKEREIYEMLEIERIGYFEKLKQAFDYDPIEGQIRWKVNCGGAKIGSVFGVKKNSVHTNIKVRGRMLTLAELAWILYYGELPQYGIYRDTIEYSKTPERPLNIYNIKAQNAHGRVIESAYDSYPLILWDEKESFWLGMVEYGYEVSQEGSFDPVYHTEYHYTGYYFRPEDALKAAVEWAEENVDSLTENASFELIEARDIIQNL